MQPQTRTFELVNLSANDYKSGVRPVWCPGCGDYGVLASFSKALADLRIPPEQIVIVSGIGCSSRFPIFVNSYGLHGTHGRALPLATGVKMAQPELVVVAVGGDGDAFSIGMGHFPHIARRNPDITYLVMDNEIYGLTKGQPSPTSPVGMEKKASPYGTLETPLDPILLALASNASFVARGFSSKPKELTELIKAAMQHKGFSFVQIISPCVSFNDMTQEFKGATLPIPATHDPRDRLAAMKLAEHPGGMYLGIFYQQPRPTYEEKMQSLQDKNARADYDLPEMMSRFMR
ncbi:MAG: 2-oxoacid:ferredoxin oxidoreductase subunit beta [Chloroflexi bacterium]|nr:2-oxoacid:ferredoxin oxidoreductase subunit beta [Chloroflexota bacterium]